ncbi:MAG: hypothetical protein IBX72_05005 [Nitrospirae bacterium]|jgi:hypothetical protein|nr:hypothetical protein [Nitrospirota bacterium]
MIVMTCPVCNRTWIDESLAIYSRSKDLPLEKKISAPCGHGFAFLVRYYDLNNEVWYYEQIDFVKEGR